MQRTAIVGVLVLAALLAMTAVTALAGHGGYHVDWWTVDAGGGQNSGNGYILHGTAGQPDSETISDGSSYTLAGGYWSGAMTQQANIFLPAIIK